MIYRTHNLTGCLVVLKSEASMRQFLGDRQRSVESKMRKSIKAVFRAGHPEKVIDVIDAKIARRCILIRISNRYGTKWWLF